MDFDQVDAPWFFHEKIAEMGYPHYFRVVSRSEFPFCKVFLIAFRCLAPEVAKAELCTVPTEAQFLPRHEFPKTS